MATIGVGQRRGDYEEPPLITAGSELEVVAELLEKSDDGYGATRVLEYLLAG